MIRSQACCPRSPLSGRGNQARGTTRCRPTTSACTFPINRERSPSPSLQLDDPNRYTLLARFMKFDPGLKWTLNYTRAPMSDGPVQMTGDLTTREASPRITSGAITVGRMAPTSEGPSPSCRHRSAGFPFRWSSFTNCGSASFRTTSAISRACSTFWPTILGASPRNSRHG